VKVSTITTVLKYWLTLVHLIVIQFGLLGITGFAPELRASEVSGEPCLLKVGVAEWRPYQYLNENGAAEGLQIELINQFAKKANCRLTFLNYRTAQSIEAIKNGTLDVIMGATDSPERRQYARFSKPYRNEMLVLYTTQEFAPKCRKKGIVQLIRQGFKLGLQKNSIYGSTINQIQQDSTLNKKIIYFDQIHSDINFVKTHGLDGIIDDPVIVAYKKRANRARESLISCHVTVYSEPVSLMFSRKTVGQEIIKRFDQAILTITNTAEYKRRWKW